MIKLDLTSKLVLQIHHRYGKKGELSSQANVRMIV